MIKRENLLFEQSLPVFRKGYIENYFGAIVRHGDFDGEILFVFVLLTERDSLHAGQELFHGGQEFFETFFFVLRWRQSDFKKREIQRLEFRQTFLETRHIAGGVEELNQEAVKVILQMRILHTSHNFQRVFDAVFEKHAVETFDLTVVSFRF